MTIRIRIQQQDFDLADEYRVLREIDSTVGAVVTFSGLVRDFEAGAQEQIEGPAKDPAKGQAKQQKHSIDSLSLQHYPGMTESLLKDIVEAALNRWALLGVTVIHRVGKLLPTEQIVFVGVASQHRAEAFEAAQFVMDYLKTKATFWKQVSQNGESFWVESKQTDQQAAERWDNSDEC